MPVDKGSYFDWGKRKFQKHIAISILPYPALTHVQCTCKCWQKVLYLRHARVKVSAFIKNVISMVSRFANSYLILKMCTLFQNHPISLFCTTAQTVLPFNH